MKRIACSTVVMAAFVLAPAHAAKIPSHFSDQLEAALSCRSEWSPAYWHSYFGTYLGAPLRRWGNADWYDAQGAELAGNATTEVFVNDDASTALMVGALIPAKVEGVRQQIEQRLGYAFVALPGPYPRYLSKFGSVLVGLSNEQTKWYCARWNLGNRP
ncbi:hypothetical protein [Andreprevotia lacus]|nr:hypothetical protein [Andreprevotia lacus]